MFFFPTGIDEQREAGGDGGALIEADGGGGKQMRGGMAKGGVEQSGPGIAETELHAQGAGAREKRHQAPVGFGVGMMFGMEVGRGAAVLAVGGFPGIDGAQVLFDGATQFEREFEIRGELAGGDALAVHEPGLLSR